MFRREVSSIDNVINQCLRENGLETPLQQLRLLEAWVKIAGAMVDKYTEEKFIRNQVLFVKINRPALRADLTMIRTELVNKLNAEIGARLIVDIRFY